MTTPLPFLREHAPQYGPAEQVSPLIRRVTARNPSPFTYRGTGTYIVGRGRVAVIDPGPLLPDHVAALLRAVEGETVTHILVTHTHADHSPAAAPLKAATGAPTYGFGPHGSGQTRIVEGHFGGGPFEEGGDRTFVPDLTMRTGDAVEGGGWRLEAVHTPGHTSNHLCFALPEEKALFTGDHIMGWSTTAIGPPDGDMAAYKASLRLLLGPDAEISVPGMGNDPESQANVSETTANAGRMSMSNVELYWPTHGPAIREPRKLVRAYLLHRLEREAGILKVLGDGVKTIPEMVARLYVGLDPRLAGAAGRSVLAHLVELSDRGLVAVDGPLSPSAHYRLKA